MKEIQTKYMKRLEAKQDEGLSQEMFFILRDQVGKTFNFTCNRFGIPFLLIFFFF